MTLIDIERVLPWKDFTPWVYALYRVNRRVLTRKIGQFRVTLRDITRNVLIFFYFFRILIACS